MEMIIAVIDSFAFRIVLAGTVLSSFGIYKKLNERGTHGDSLATRLDTMIPFVPAFSVPYLLYLPYLFLLVAYGILATQWFAHVAATTLAVQLAAAFVYATHDTYVPRPETVGEGPFARLVAFVYRHDRPYCAFPSLHVAYSVLCAYWTSVLLPPLFPAALVLTAAIVLSTVFLKQHVVADVVGGLLVAAVAIAAVI